MKTWFWFVFFSITGVAEPLSQRIIGEEVHVEEHHRKEQTFTLTEEERQRRLKNFEAIRPIIDDKVRQNYLPAPSEGAPIGEWYKFAYHRCEDVRQFMTVHLLRTEANRSRYEALDAQRDALFRATVRTAHWDSPGSHSSTVLQSYKDLINGIHALHLTLAIEKWHSDQGYDIPVIPKKD